MVPEDQKTNVTSRSEMKGGGLRGMRRVKRREFEAVKPLRTPPRYWRSAAAKLPLSPSRNTKAPQRCEERSGSWTVENTIRFQQSGVEVPESGKTKIVFFELC